MYPGFESPLPACSWTCRRTWMIETCGPPFADERRQVSHSPAHHRSQSIKDIKDDACTHA